jgi:hypothetical protein
MRGGEASDSCVGALGRKPASSPGRCLRARLISRPLRSCGPGRENQVRWPRYAGRGSHNAQHTGRACAVELRHGLCVRRPQGDAVTRSQATSGKGTPLHRHCGLQPQGGLWATGTRRRAWRRAERRPGFGCFAKRRGRTPRATNVRPIIGLRPAVRWGLVPSRRTILAGGCRAKRALKRVVGAGMDGAGESVWSELSRGMR